MSSSETTIAKGLFVALVFERHIDSEYRGLVKVGSQYYWISSRQRAYRFEELKLDHFDNIVRKYHENNEELPEIFIETRKIIVERESE